MGGLVLTDRDCPTAEVSPCGKLLEESEMLRKTFEFVRTVFDSAREEPIGTMVAVVRRKRTAREPGGGWCTLCL